MLGSTPNSPHILQELINSLSDSSTSSFDHRPVTYCELLKQLKNLRSDCSTGADQIPAKYLKMSANHIASLLTQIINPLSPKSDQRQISPCNINALQNRVVMRIKDMITQDESTVFIRISAQPRISAHLE